MRHQLPDRDVELDDTTVSLPAHGRRPHVILLTRLLPQIPAQ